MVWGENQSGGGGEISLKISIHFLKIIYILNNLEAQK
jgi:hypothetical protein